MSATIETSLFTNYLASEMDNHLIPAPVVEVFGRQYEVQQYYIDNIPFVEVIIFCKSRVIQRTKTPD